MYTALYIKKSSKCLNNNSVFNSSFPIPEVKVKVLQSCLTLTPWNSLDQNIGVSSLSLLQGIFPTQGLNSGLLHCRQILYH